MGALAEVGHGNFGFVKDASALATFLDRELVETATTMVEGTKLRLELPRGVSFVRVVGGVAQLLESALEVDVGSISAGDKRRVVVELRSSLELGERVSLGGDVSWSRIGQGPVRLALSGISLHSTDDLAAVEKSRDPEIFGGGTSAFASVRQIEAAQAYAHGDVKRADELLDENERALGAAMLVAPAAAPPLAQQASAVRDTRREFQRVAPKSAEGNAAAKSVFERDTNNTRKTIF